MKRISRILLWMVTGMVPVVISACYGVMQSYRRTGKVLDMKTGSGIVGIKVSCVAADGKVLYSDVTTSGGTFELAPPNAEFCATIAAKDVDGPGNGGQYADVSVAAGSATSAASSSLVVNMSRHP